MRGGKMTPDYDFSYLSAAQVELLIYLEVDVTFSQIMADQAERLGFPLALGETIGSAMTSKPRAMFNNG
jgi:hypothetical protein